MADPGSLIAQGLSNFGTGTAQGSANYQQYLQQDAAATGSVNAFLGQGPSAIQSLSPDGQALVDKQMAGNATRKDRLQLLGEIHSAQTLRQNNTSQQMAQAQLQEQQYKVRQAQYQAQMIQKYANQAQQQQAPATDPNQTGPQNASPYVLNNQANSAQNAGQPQGAAPQPTPLFKQPRVTMTDPQVSNMIQRMVPQIATQNGFDFKDASDKAQQAAQTYVDGQNSQESPVGFAPAGFDQSTRQNIWQPLVGKRGGTITASGPVQKMVGQPKGPVLVQDDNGNWIHAAQKMGLDAAKVDDAPNAEQIIPGDKQQGIISDANAKVASAGASQNLANQLMAAATAYTTNNTGVLNSIKGTPQGQKFMAALGDGSGQLLQNLADDQMVPLVQQLRGQGAIRNTEIDFLKAPTVSPAKGNTLIMDLADMNKQKTDFSNQRAQAYQYYASHGWGEGDSGLKAQEKVPMPNMFLRSTRMAASKAPAQALQYLRANPATADKFDAAFGPGTSAYVLNPGPNSSSGTQSQ